MGLVAASSDRALNVSRGGFAAFHQNGIRRQRNPANTKSATLVTPFAFCFGTQVKITLKRRV